MVEHTLAYREAVKFIGTYIDAVIEKVSATPDGLLHPGYGTMFTRTGRLNGEGGINIQNFPSHKHRELRNMIVAPKGFSLYAFDMGQLEVRVLAMACRDKRLIHEIINKVDIHTLWLQHVVDVYPEYMDRLRRETGEHDDTKLMKAGRNIIKSDFVFNLFYGGGVESVSIRTGIPTDIVAELKAALWGAYPDIPTWHKEMRRQYRETGCVYTLTGRGRNELLPGNEPINDGIQGTGSDLMLDAQNQLAQISRIERDPIIHPRMNQHDDLTFIFPDGPSVYRYIEMAVDEMIQVRYPWQIVPLTIEGKVGKSWGQMNDFATFEGKWVR